MATLIEPRHIISANMYGGSVLSHRRWDQLKRHGSSLLKIGALAAALSGAHYSGRDAGKRDTTAYFDSKLHEELAEAHRRGYLKAVAGDWAT